MPLYKYIYPLGFTLRRFFLFINKKLVLLATDTQYIVYNKTLTTIYSIRKR